MLHRTDCIVHNWLCVVSGHGLLQLPRLMEKSTPQLPKQGRTLHSHALCVLRAAPMYTLCMIMAVSQVAPQTLVSLAHL